MLATKRILSRPVISKTCIINITFIITFVTHQRRWKSLYVKYYISYSVSIIYKYSHQPRWKSLEPPNRILWDVQALVLRRRDLALQTLFRSIAKTLVLVSSLLQFSDQTTDRDRWDWSIWATTAIVLISKLAIRVPIFSMWGGEKRMSLALPSFSMWSSNNLSLDKKAS